MLKIVSLFLVGIAVLGIFGRARLMKRLGKGKGDLAARLKRSETCPKCGRFRLGTGPCECGSGRG